MKQTSRDRILGRIALASRSLPLADDPAFEHDRTPPQQAECISLFCERLQEYGASNQLVTATDLPGALAKKLEEHGLRSIVLPTGIPSDWLARIAGVDLLFDEDQSVASIESADAVLTASTAAVAASGSIVLQHGPAEGRRILTLLPDRHLCMVEAEAICATLPLALQRLSPTLPTTFISGPSATADIEMTRIQGVHGPRQLDVFIVVSAVHDNNLPDKEFRCP